ncbi:methylenetetrahydrofolate reductase [Propionimicrobium sp. PCR01-08-3]|uniref:methylenetetrahydrofolate reductase n=1 Tax=Propionimicrobium sp. PCR01-08-3 TaxID=3052086 RepID=UPI00255CAB53|nr:methylenetetrahydrofolate reductase [Propionimicrobium sp. PCR01-08-3]WIY81666.1 methylenetetrahydrofolate reductase [Propionimicrobium sp. PCR01-08-3]
MSSRESIGELLARATEPTFSFEFFPPKDEAGQQMLTRTIADLEELRPDWVSVTYGANGSSRQRTLDATMSILASTDFRVVGHITCTGQTVGELSQAIDAYGEAGVTNILAIRGDMPGGARVPWEPHPGGLRNATELVELIASRGDFTIGVGAFPDGHSTSTPELDAQILLGKQRAGASFAVTQLFFDLGHYFELVGRARSAGCTLPIVPGIMPVTSVKQLGRFAELSGADIPAKVAERLLGVADDPAQVRETGAQIAAELCDRLLAGKAPGLHFYTQNRSRATREILAKLRDVHRPDRW